MTDLRSMASAEDPVLADTRRRVADLFFAQSEAAIQRRSPLYRGLLARLGEDVLRGGPAWDLLARRAGERRGEALPLRLMAAVHRLVLTGDAPELAAYYPSVGGNGTPTEAWPAF